MDAEITKEFLAAEDAELVAEWENQLAFLKSAAKNAASVEDIAKVLAVMQACADHYSDVLLNTGIAAVRRHLGLTPVDWPVDQDGKLIIL